LRYDESATLVVPCLQREQYKSGYDLVSPSDFVSIFSKVAKSFHSTLTQAYLELLKSAESVFDIVCEHIGISGEDRATLMQQLKQKGTRLSFP
jgi:hypothetical protein